jgi:hypothetical protein
MAAEERLAEEGNEVMQVNVALAFDHIERWEVGGVAGEIARLEQQAAASEARAASSPYKGGKRKAAALAAAKDLRAMADLLRTEAKKGSK